MAKLRAEWERFQKSQETLCPACRQLLAAYPLQDEENPAGVLGVAVYGAATTVVIYFQVTIPAPSPTDPAGYTVKIVKVSFLTVPDVAAVYRNDPLSRGRLVTFPGAAGDCCELQIEELDIRSAFVYSSQPGGGHRHKTHP